MGYRRQDFACLIILFAIATPTAALAYSEPGTTSVFVYSAFDYSAQRPKTPTRVLGEPRSEYKLSFPAVSGGAGIERKLSKTVSVNFSAEYGQQTYERRRRATSCFLGTTCISENNYERLEKQAFGVWFGAKNRLNGLVSSELAIGGGYESWDLMGSSSQSGPFRSRDGEQSLIPIRFAARLTYSWVLEPMLSAVYQHNISSPSPTLTKPGIQGDIISASFMLRWHIVSW